MLVPLFPLRTVLVPGMVLPLHIFEPRYRVMVRGLAARPEEDRGFGIVAVRAGAPQGGEGIENLHAVGTMARVTGIEPLEDGRFDLVTVGARRFHLDGIEASSPYALARVTLLDEVECVDGQQDAAHAEAARAIAYLTAYRDVIARWGVIDIAELHDLPSDPVALSHLVSSAIVTDLSTRQRLLELPDAVTRLRATIDLLRSEIALMSAVPSMPAVDLPEFRTLSRN